MWQILTHNTRDYASCKVLANVLLHIIQFCEQSRLQRCTLDCQHSFVINVSQSY
jgi:hypothetical protein